MGVTEGMATRCAAAAVLALAATLLLLAPTSAGALDSDLKGSAIFRVEASNGYSILALAASERLDGRTDIALIVHRRGASATYAAPATVTPTRLQADLGNLGRISLEIAPSGVERTLKSRCGERPLTFEPDIYRGVFEFRGEEGYTVARATTLGEYARFWLDFGCGSFGWEETGGPSEPGAKLRLNRGRGHNRLNLQVNKNRPGARSRLEAEVHEKRGRIEISRGLATWAGAGAFEYDPLLRSATLSPPKPFAGHATFHRGTTPSNRWTGNLTIDLPGRSEVPLTGTGVRATLVPACRHEGERRHRC